MFQFQFQHNKHNLNDPLRMMSQSQIIHNHQNYAVWSHHPPPYPAVCPRMPPFTTQERPPQANHPGRVNWNRIQPEARKYFSRGGNFGSGSGHFNPVDSQLPVTNRSTGRPRRFHHYKRRFSGGGGGRFVTPFAPRNTTSFVIRAKQSGGVAPVVSPYVPTPAYLPTPAIILTPGMSPSTEEIIKTAKEEWGVNSYGSMKGLIRLRTDREYSNSDPEANSVEIGGGDDNNDVKEQIEFEKRLDQDLSRFEIIFPKKNVNGQKLQIAHLEEENLTLKERIFLMERELGELRRRIINLEADRIDGDGYGNGDGDVKDACSENSIGNYGEKNKSG